MDEQPRDPGRERKEITERQKVVETGHAPDGERVERVDRTETNRAAPNTTWMWIVPLLLLVAFLLWYVLARGERNESGIDFPSVEAPTVEVPAPQQRIEIEVPAADQPATEATQPSAGGTQPPGG